MKLSVLDEGLELPAKKQLMAYMEAIAGDCRLPKEIKDVACAIVEPWLNPPF